VDAERMSLGHWLLVTVSASFLQCFDSGDFVAGRTTGLYKPHSTYPRGHLPELEKEETPVGTG